MHFQRYWDLAWVERTKSHGSLELDSRTNSLNTYTVGNGGSCARRSVMKCITAVRCLLKPCSSHPAAGGEKKVAVGVENFDRGAVT